MGIVENGAKIATFNHLRVTTSGLWFSRMPQLFCLVMGIAPIRHATKGTQGNRDRTYDGGLGRRFPTLAVPKRDYPFCVERFLSPWEA